VDWLSEVGRGLFVAAGLYWKALWALALGYAVSAFIQVFVSRREAARHLGEDGPRQLGLAMLLGFISSSCSFAALSATRSLFTKGAALISALAFMFAATNLALELAFLLWIFLGWQFVLALFLGAPILVAAMAVLVRITGQHDAIEAAREHARQVEAGGEEPSAGLPQAWSDRLRSRQAWHRIGRAYLGEWGMVWKELLVGFTVAGFVAALVPDAFFEAIFPTGLALVLLVPIHALLGPVLALITVIGSMGNGPLAAVLWENGVLFAGIMAFLYSDFVVIPSLKINATYYGWRFALYLGLVFAAAAVITGIVIHAGFAVLGLIPEPSGNVERLATFAVDYTLALNLVAITVAAILIWLARTGPPQPAPAPSGA
jgi:uncharacterized membrane protein YraQ (UPF0718 family)